MVRSSRVTRTEELARFVSSTRSSSIPSAVKEQAKMVLLDTLGAMVRASSRRYPAGDALARFVGEVGGGGRSTIVGRGLKTDMVTAALVNGTFGYYCDIESHHAEAVTHVAAVIIPVALAVAEARGLRGNDVLASLAVGFDVETRVSRALDPVALYQRGFHPSAVAGCFGAAATAGRLIGLSTARQVAAFGLAGCQASGLLAWVTDRSENSRPLQMGIAARNGVTAALLAERGIGAPPDIFEGKNGMMGAFTDHPRPRMLTEDLGSRFTIREVAFKQYSCCAFLHPALDALMSIMTHHGVTHDDIDRIVLRFPSPGASIIDNNELKSHSAQYILPVAAVRGGVEIEDILCDSRSDPEVKRLSGRTKLVYDEELATFFPERYASVVSVRTKDGRSYTERVDYARGTPENPLSPGEIRQKFRRLTAGELSKERADSCIEIVNSFDDSASVNPLAALIG